MSPPSSKIDDVQEETNEKPTDESPEESSAENKPTVNKKTKPTENKPEPVPEGKFTLRNLFTVERPHFFYNILQTLVFAVLTILIAKMKYLLTPCLCLIASTFPLRTWLPKNYGLWTIYLLIIVSCIADRGLQNVSQQYSMKEFNNTEQNTYDDNLFEMLNWINANTDRNAVFAGKLAGMS